MKESLTIVNDDRDPSADSRARRRITFLYVVIDGRRPLTGTVSRHALTGVVEVTLKRGDRAAFARAREKEGDRLTLEFPSQRLSKPHAALRPVDGKWTIHDLKSTNGTEVNGRPVSVATLNPGDIITAAGHICLVLASADFGTEAIEQDLVLSTTDEGVPGIRTLSPALTTDFANLRQIAPRAITVTLVGEPGTGKEVVSSAIHALSGRRGPFVAINCAAIPKDLVASTLFGHQRGAFSGATADARGSIRAAQGGTLLLDEINSTNEESFQVALLRAIQNREVTPVGAHDSVPVDVRFVAATQTPLSRAVAEGKFREDLRARLEGFTFTIPPLRQRKVDLGVLISTLLRRLGVTEANQPPFTSEALIRILRHDWPTNIRGLEQALERALALTRDGTMHASLFPEPVIMNRPESVPTDTEGPAPNDSLRAELEEALRITHGNVAEASRRMGRSRPLVHRWLKRFKIDPDDFR